jgi:inner membrane protein
MTHSFLATAIMVALAWPLSFHPPPLWKVVCWAFFFGWFADAFTKSGVAAFYPLTSARLVIPGNPRLRLSSGSKAEYAVIALLIVVLGVSVHINTRGGVMRTFATLLGQPESVAKLYQSEGARRRVFAQIEGRFASSGTPVRGSFEVVDVNGENLLVRGETGALYLAGKTQLRPGLSDPD